MAQVAIREFDAKKMFETFSGNPYHGVLITEISDVEKKISEAHFPTEKYVVKPDQLFGKRGKYGLVGVNLDENGVKNWLQEKYQSQVII